MGVLVSSQQTQQRWRRSRSFIFFLWLVGVVPLAESQAPSVKRLFGMISPEMTEPDDATTRAKYQSSCYAGLEPQNFDGACVHARSDLQGPEGSPMPDEVEGLNNLAVVCLECCSNALCNDDDFDDSTGNCEGVGYYDVWRLRCTVASGWTTISSQLTTYLRDKQIRFLRNLNPADNKLTICEFPRMGKTYKRCDPDELKEYGGTYCQLFVDDPETTFTCGKDTEHDRKFWSCEDQEKDGFMYTDAKCECRVPQGYYAVSTTIDDPSCEDGGGSCRVFTGYRLELGISDETSGLGGDHWRAVRSCEVTTYEWRNDFMAPSEWDGFVVKQDFVLRNEPVYSPFDEQSFLITLIFFAFMIFVILQVVACFRSTPCSICGKRLFICRDVCIWCRFYGAERPDPTLYKACKARREPLSGKTFSQFCIEGPYRGGHAAIKRKIQVENGKVKVVRVYKPPPIPVIDHSLSLRRPKKIQVAPAP